MLGSPNKTEKERMKEKLFKEIQQVEFTVEALETFVKEDRDMLIQLLRKNVNSMKVIAKGVLDD
ncbi:MULTISPECIES: hypothetical protein [Enterobacter cloacae complex]|uniref:hypothetical protein n=1 Tax=Enterobacter cloacae complex TaxID=354276 RepID=UPI0010107160|nr:MULTISPECIES: hypothetical protein [Enterobacter cloacae complex]MDQ6584453.1 hypothetical protein [Enterobacter hormaechei]